LPAELEICITTTAEVIAKRFLERYRYSSVPAVESAYAKLCFATKTIRAIILKSVQSVIQKQPIITF